MTIPVQTTTVEQLVDTLSLEDKAGLLFHAMAFIIPTPDGTVELGPVRHHIAAQRISHFAVMGPASPETIGTLADEIAAFAAQTGLQVPVTLSSDPRQVTADRPGHASAASGFSEWPEPLGLAAIRNPNAAYAAGRATAEEFRAAGLHTLLGPQLDVLTELRWARGTGTFGGDPDLVIETARAYLRGLHGSEPSTRVSSVIKHFPGAGPQRDGEDSHFVYGQDQVYPGGHFDTHLRPFAELIAEGVSQVMPYYSKPVGTEFDEVGFAFNKRIITGILRDQLQFDGVVLTDFGVLTDQNLFGETIPARAWGLQDATVDERILRALDAGVDQFGGEAVPEIVVQLVQDGRLSMERLDESVLRILHEKQRLGLFESTQRPEMTPARREDLRQQGASAQRSAVTVLKPSGDVGSSTPVITIDAAGASEHDLGALDAAIVMVGSPFEPRDGFFEAMFPAGSLKYPEAQTRAILELAARIPVTLVVDLTRPAILTPFADAVGGLYVHYGSSTAAVLDVVLGRATGAGKLPVQLPRTTEDVTAGSIDQPLRIQDPLFPFGAGR